MKRFLVVSERLELTGEPPQITHPLGRPEIDLSGTMQVCENCNSIILGQNAPRCLCGQALVYSPQ